MVFESLPVVADLGHDSVKTSGVSTGCLVLLLGQQYVHKWLHANRINRAIMIVHYHTHLECHPLFHIIAPFA